MVRLRSLLVILSLVVAADVTAADASSAGSKCTKVGLVKRSTSGNLQCKKSGSKLVWMPQRSTKSVVTTTTVAPTVATPAVPTGWSDVETYAAGVAFASWKASAAAIAAGTSKMPTPRYLTGPNVVITNSAPETAINLASRLFSSAAQPTQLTILRYGYADVDWASSQWTGKLQFCCRSRN